jgi:hypothetical protein
VPRLASPFIVALRERGPTAIHGRRPRSGRVSDRETDPEIRLEITFLTHIIASRMNSPTYYRRGGLGKVQMIVTPTIFMSSKRYGNPRVP